MIALISRWLSGRAMKREDGQLRDRVISAKAKLEAAERRGDTRTQGHALMELRAAKHAQLAREIWG